MGVGVGCGAGADAAAVVGEGESEGEGTEELGAALGALDVEAVEAVESKTEPATSQVASPQSGACARG